jgi:hypothetical protein
LPRILQRPARQGDKYRKLGPVNRLTVYEEATGKDGNQSLVERPIFVCCPTLLRPKGNQIVLAELSELI